jgi:hypothetical protein
MRLRMFGPLVLGLIALSCSDSTEPSNQPRILLLNPRVVPP